jgi:uncharacterized protein (TIGR00730 family)
MKIAVFCGSSRKVDGRYLELARALGVELARRGHVLIYGGGRTGLMGAVADGALAAGGTVRGVILRDFIEMDVHHPGLHELETVDDMRARKAGLDALADAFIALPGGLGTLEELAEILSFRKLDLHRRRLIFLDIGGFWTPLLRWIDTAIEQRFDSAEVRSYFAVTTNASEAVSSCETN